MKAISNHAGTGLKRLIDACIREFSRWRSRSFRAVQVCLLLMPLMVPTMALEASYSRGKAPEAESASSELTEEEKEMLQDREILENLDLLQNLDTIEFLDFLNEMDPDWSESDESAIPAEIEEEEQ